MKYSQSTPADRPVSWSTAKVHLRLDDTTEKEYVESLVDACTAHAEEAMATSLISRTITAIYYADEPVHLPRGPVTSITSVVDDDGRTITDYDLERVGNSDRLKVNVSFAYPLTVVYTAGYANAAAVPADIRHAILCHVATLYTNRESVAAVGLKAVPHQLEDFYRLRSRKTGVA